MKNNMHTFKFWETLLLSSILLFFVDTFILFGAFFITIPLTLILGIVASVFAIKEKNSIFVLVNILLMLLPIATFFIMPW